MSFVLFRLIDVYAKWREAFLTAHPEKRLIPEYPEDSETLANGVPFITVGEKGKKLGVVVVALVALLLLSDRD